MSGRQQDTLDPALGGSGAPPSQPPPPVAPPAPYYQQQYAPPHDQPQQATPHYNASPYPSMPIPPPGHTPSHGSMHTPTDYSMPPPAPDAADHSNDDHNVSPSAPGLPGQEDIKRPRACESCRSLKVKCDQPEDRPDLPCRRCAKAGRACIITQPSRKRQKKSDHRVDELEKKLSVLSEVLERQRGMNPPPFGSPAEESPRPYDRAFGRQSISSQQSYGTPYNAYTPEGGNGLKRRRGDDAPQDPSTPHFLQHRKSYSGAAPRSDALNTKHEDSSSIEHSWGIASDVKRFLHHISPTEFIQRINTLIPPDQAAVLFHRYNVVLAPHLPAVVFPQGTTAEQLYKEKPLLYLAVIGAASWGQSDPEISREVIREAIGAIADCAIRNGAKSLELIQAMQIICLWYKPPEQSEQTNFYQIIHIAAVMALDIGLGKRFNPAKAMRGVMGPAKDFPPGAGIRMMPVNSDDLEARRAWLGCYYLCASASMVLRRPNLVSWTKYMDECVEELTNNPDAAPTDKLFCQHIKLQRICEEVGQQFHMDDPSANINIDDAQVAYNVRNLESQLSQWKSNIPRECRTPGLVFFEHVCSLYAHEIVLHQNHNVDDFKMPFNEESLKNVNAGSGALTNNQITALKACVRAAHGILNTMLSFDLETVVSLPMLLYFVRCVYAIVILIKMHVAVCIPNSELGKLFEPEDLKVETYLNGLMEHFAKIGRQRQIRPDKILRILGVLRDWFEEKHKKGVAAQRGQKEHDDTQQARQSGLQMLSQVATGEQNPEAKRMNNPDWTFDRATAMPYGPQYPANPPATNAPYDSVMPFYNNPGSFAPHDPNVQPEFGWDLGVQQAMDIALGDMNGLQGNGLDNWLLGGESMMPFVSYDSGGANAPAMGPGFQ